MEGRFMASGSRRGRVFAAVAVVAGLLAGAPGAIGAVGTPPVPHVTFPEAFTENDITITGSATDDVSVVRVRVGVKQRDSKLWLQPDGTFGPVSRRYEAVLVDPGAPSTGWTFDVTLPDDNYLLSARAFDDEGNSDSLKPWRGFEVDATGPSIEPAFPFGATLLGPDVILNGRLEDENNMGRPRIAIKDRDTGLWLRPDGSFGAGQVKMDVFTWTCRPEQRVFCLPGSPNDLDETIMAWIFPVELPPGDYAMAFSVPDVFGNLSSLKPARRFSVSETIDTLPIPATDVTKGQRFSGPDISITGGAIDDLGIARVRVGIKDRDTGLWWGGFGFTDRPVRVDAQIDQPGDAEATWRYETELPDGNYALSVRAFDVQGYSDSIRPWVQFTVDST
jgi:hypothetical protein